MQKANGGVLWPHAPSRQQVFPLYAHNMDAYAPLLDSEKVTAVVEDLIGEELVHTTSEGIHHWSGTAWHHDDVGPDGTAHLKVVMFLNPVRVDTGCICVLPGSQFQPYRERMERNGGSILPLGPDVPGM